MSIITPITGGAGVVPLGALARGHHTVKARALAGEAGEFAGGWAETDLYLPEWVKPDATLDLDFLGWQAYAEPAGLGRGGVISTPDAALTVSRPSGRGRRTSLGVFETLADNLIARDHDDAGTALGLQIEPQATYNRVSSLMTGFVAGSPGTAPDGWSIPAPAGLTRTLSLVTTSGRPKLRVHYAGAPSGNFQFLAQFLPSLTLAAASGQTWTYAARFSGQGTGLNGSGLSIGHWETDGSNAILRSDAVSATAPVAHARRSKTVTLGAGTAYLRFFASTGIITAGTTCDFWIDIEAPQLTQTAFLPSEYLVGTSSAERYADGISTSITGLIGAVEGGLYIDCQPIDSGEVQYIAHLDDGTTSNRIQIRRDSDDVIKASVIVGGVIQGGTMSLGSHTGGSVVRVAFAWATGEFVGRMTGGSLQTIAAPTMPPGLTTLRLGSGVSKVSPLNGHLRRVSAFPTRAIMSNTKIAELVA